MKLKNLYHWTVLVPIIAGIYLLTGLLTDGALSTIGGGILLFGSVLAAVHHAEVIAHKVGEPYGSIVLAICITILEVGLIISFMLSGGEGAVTYARDTVFAAVMLLLNGILGVCIWIGAVKYKEQNYMRSSATTYLVSLVAILVLTLILPNYTSSVRGPFYNESQLVFVSIACLVIYGIFLMVQTVRHRNYFIIEDENHTPHEADPPTRTVTVVSLILLLISLAVVIFMAKGLSPVIESFVADMGAPRALVGVIIASMVLLPEGFAAIRAARSNHLQSSINLTLGSAMASVGLTIPAVSAVCIWFDIPFVLGLDMKSIILLALSVFIVMISLSRGKTNVMYGAVLLVNLAAYIFTVIVP
ncbi:calcium:proton antiporter [Chryseobacterium sp. MFBS3-17]|uniref:calcium:proton antiporter n=1 Tax=Chryseobacterium sp. MFBS3-17 TaxID=2886689 RepID=UPI001D0EB1E8|nr:ionic transporter y4hA [Chryseobacterium sp. MFBS3-17]MCC2590473.1 ionic transporter y4hA [Chryseobacterium sp. MFBS3-17]